MIQKNTKSNTFRKWKIKWIKWFNRNNLVQRRSN